MSDDGFKRAELGEVVKFGETGEHIEGVYMGYEESSQYKDSYALSFKDSDGVKIIFVNKIIIDIINRNVKEFVVGSTIIRVIYKGKQKTQDGKKEYHDYEVFFKN